MTTRRSFVTFVLGMAFAVMSVPGYARDYDAVALPRLYELDVPTGDIAALALNNVGQVVGHSPAGLGGPIHATLWKNLVPTDLSPQASFGSAAAISDSGLIAGSIDGMAVVWRRGTVVTLPTLGGQGGVASAINNRGQVAGSSQLPGGQSHATLWNGNVPTDLTPGAHILQSFATAINSVGVIVGTVENLAVRWERGSMVRLGTLGGQSSSAADINEAGRIVGAATDEGGIGHAVIWNGDTPVSLDSRRDRFSWASGINRSGHVVGAVEFPGAPAGSHAVLWDRGVMIDLNQYLSPDLVTAGWTLVRATAINDRGQILAEGLNLDRPELRPFLLSPVP